MSEVSEGRGRAERQTKPLAHGHDGPFEYE